MSRTPITGTFSALSCFSVSLIDDSDIDLLVGELDSGGIEALLGLLADIESEFSLKLIFNSFCDYIISQNGTKVNAFFEGVF